MARMTATEAARSFSEVLTRAQRGERIEVTRNGATVAVIAPPPAKRQWVPGKEVRELLESLPPVDEDFVRDLREIRRWSGPLRDPWAS